MSNRLFLCLVLLAAAHCHTIKGQLDALNKARTTPSYFATFVQTQYKDKTNNANKQHNEWNLVFNEATPGVFDTAITYLNGKSASSSWTIDMGMTWVMYNHTKYLGTELKSLSHTGKGGTSFSDRLKTMTNNFNTFGGENLISNSITAKNDEHMIADWIIDDGVSSRGHRDNIYSGNYNKIGVGIYKDTTANKWYIGTVMAGTFNCDHCGTITCAMQQEMGWTDYLKAIGQTDPCAAQNNLGGSSNNSGTNTSKSVNPDGKPNFSFGVITQLASGFICVISALAASY